MAYIRYLGRGCGRLKPRHAFPKSITREKFAKLRSGEPVEVTEEEANLISKWLGMEKVTLPKKQKKSYIKHEERNPTTDKNQEENKDTEEKKEGEE